MYQDNTVSHKYVQLYKLFFSFRKRKIKHPELAFYLRMQASKKETSCLSCYLQGRVSPSRHRTDVQFSSVPQRANLKSEKPHYTLIPKEWPIIHHSRFSGWPYAHPYVYMSSTGGSLGYGRGGNNNEVGWGSLRGVGGGE